MCAAPPLLLASIQGADSGFSGVTGEQNCAACHSSGSGFGGVQIAFPNGSFYTPGQKQHLVVTITDTPQQSWGFQLSARQVNSLTTQAGNFTPGGEGFTQTVCVDTAFKKEQFGASPCPSTLPLQYIEQTSSGARAGTKRAIMFEFDWTPPSNDIGPIIMNIAAVAGDGSDTTGGSHVYVSNYTLTIPVSNQPLITQVQNGASFASTFAPGGWITIKGNNLASGTRIWRNDEIVNGQLPAQLDGVRVSISGKAAYVEYISPTQVNALAPTDAPLGTAVAVTVTNNGLASNPGNVLIVNPSPALFLWPSSYAVATHANFTIAGPPDLFPGTASVPAKPGETIILWASGLGPTFPPVASGRITPSDRLYPISFPLAVNIGGIGAQVVGAALAPGYAGLYQIAVTIPDSLPDGDQPVTLTSVGNSSPSGVLLNVRK